MVKFAIPIPAFVTTAILTLIACSPNPTPNNGEQSPGMATAGPVELETLTIEQEQGNCADASPEKSCALVKMTYPSVKKGSEALKSAVNLWATDFMLGMLEPSAEMDQEQSMESAIQGFFNMHEESVKDFPDGNLLYTVEVSDTVLLNDGKYLTLRLDGYSYAGGAHGNPTAGVGSFEVATGQPVTLESLVTNLDSLAQRAEQKFRVVRKEDFAEGFDFDQVFPFKLADNIGIVENGLFFCYVPYEVAPYAMGFTEFVLPFDDIKDLMRNRAQ
ncbi:MAG: DUF4163 domain-containing protein [Saprospiraceae bacterium]